MFLVIISVLSSIGILSYFKVETTLIIFEILPFLVLAVGVDNIFILVQRYQRTPRKKYETHAEHIGRVTGKVAPSMLLSSVSESTCFFLGALTEMPAVRAFALYAGTSLLINFILQITCFIALISLDMERENNNRFDVACCVTAPKKLSDPDSDTAHESVLYKIFKYFYAPFLMNKFVRPTVVAIFVSWLCFSLSTVPKIEVGLDQELSMPSDSFVLKYFQFLNKYLSVGPPVYFVVNNTGLEIDFADKDIQKRLCGSSNCYSDSLTNQIKLWGDQSNVTYIATASQSWIDDYLSWMTDDDHCCQYNKTATEEFPYGSIIQVNPPPDDPEKRIKKGEYCNDWEKSDADYKSADNITKTDFRTLVDWFLQQDPGIKCALSGHAAYVSSLYMEPRPCEDDTLTTTSISPSSSLISNNAFYGSESNLGLGPKCDPQPDDNGNMQSWCAHYNESLPQYDILAANFMSYHTILRTSEDFTEALRWARRLSDNITETLNRDLNINGTVNVFPYSIFYVFYEQYLTSWEDTASSLSISLVSILLVSFIFLGFDFRSACIIVFVIWMILMDLIGLMYAWGITLNAVSLTNLVMAVGISVEFCAHITRDFVYTTGVSKVERSKSSLINIGSSVGSIY